MLPLLAAGSMGMAQAQELLFTATLQDKLANRDNLEGEIAPLTSQNKTIGFLIGARQEDKYDEEGSWRDSENYKDQRILTIFSPEGKPLQALPTSTKYKYLDDVELLPFGDGGFCVIAESYQSNGDSYVSAGEVVFYTYSNGTWIENKRIITYDSAMGEFGYSYGQDKDESVFPNLANPTATFALFKDDGNKVVAEVYVANKQTLTPAPLPSITSDLSELSVKKGKAMTPYATTTNFTATGFSAVGLPAGLSINPVSGVISGKTAAKGAFNVLLVVSQSGGQPVVATKRFVVK